MKYIQTGTWLVLLGCCLTAAPAEPRPGEARRDSTLNDIHAFDKNNLIVVGDAGTILRSYDGGATWNPTDVPAGAKNNLLSICFVNSDTGWVTGSNGMLLRSTDGGNNWTRVKWTRPHDDTTYSLKRAHFVDTQHGWVLGSSNALGKVRIVNGSTARIPNAIILRTEDGGERWTQLKRSLSEFNSMFFVDQNVGFLVGKEIRDALLLTVILKTTDSGNRWGRVLTLDAESRHFSSSRLSSIFFVDKVTGFVAGSSFDDTPDDFPLLYKTTNGGNSWHGLLEPNVARWLTSHELYFVYFLDAKRGWITGDCGVILKTVDGGHSWEEQWQSTCDAPDVRAITFTDLVNGWAVGTSGAILRTINGGINWERH